MAGEVGVPGVRVDEFAAFEGGGHGEVHGEGAQRVVGAVERGPRPVAHDAARGALAPAVHVQVREGPQLAGEELDMDARAAVHVRRVLPGQQSHSHAEPPSYRIPAGAFHGHPEGRLGKTAMLSGGPESRPRPARRAVEAAVSAEAAAGEPVVEAAAAAAQGTGSTVADRSGCVNRSATRARARSATSVRPLASAHRCSWRQAPASAEPAFPTTGPPTCGVGCAEPPPAGRGGRPVRPLRSPPPAGRVPRTATGRPERCRPDPTAAAPGRGPAAARTARRRRARPTTDGPRGPAAPPRPRSGARAPADSPRLSEPENSEDPTRHLWDHRLGERRTPVRASAAGHAAVRRCVVRRSRRASRAPRVPGRVPRTAVVPSP